MEFEFHGYDSVLTPVDDDDDDDDDDDSDWKLFSKHYKRTLFEGFFSF